MFKILFIILSLLAIMKLNHWSETKKWNEIRTINEEHASIEEAYYYPDSYNAASVKNF
ncbi:MAG: hypothetical protein RBU23_01420 [Candidatus Auribacterota bacterium]|jgi:hypothetical protein|nr:hypothetical protein [Candidatus Auribacterota bacterium]